MTRMRRMLRLLKWAGVSLLALALFLAVLVQGQQWLLRWRAERLMADMHQIRLYQSTWADAQRLMRKWGAWGHYDGGCTPQDCRYKIELGSLWEIGTEHLDRPLDRLWFRTVGSGIFGTRLAALGTSFVVHDGTIWRTEAEAVVDVRPRWFEDPNLDYSLIVETKSRPSLHESKADLSILGDDDQLADHPYYKVGRPGGCENCFAAHVTYSTRAPQEQIARLTDFNLSCFTQIHPCRWLGDLLPIAWDWRLYSRFEPGHTLAMDLPEPARPCAEPVWALARDWGHAIVIEDLADGRNSTFDGPLEWSQVRVVGSLKGTLPFASDTQLSVYRPDEYPEAAQHMTPGGRFVVFFDDFGRDAERNEPRPEIMLEACGIQPDTPEARREAAKGIAMNDDLRRPENW